MKYISLAFLLFLELTALAAFAVFLLVCAGLWTGVIR